MGRIAAQAKYVRIAELFKRRIENSDYVFNTLPGAQKLAEDTGVSYLTARQAIRKLIDDGVLVRQATGRLAVNRTSGARPRRFNAVYIRQAPMDDYSIWDYTLRQTAEELGCGYRTIFYTHEDDPLILDALNGDFDLIFFWFHRTDELFLEKLKRNRDRLVVMFHDLTAHGIRCVDGTVPEAIGSLMEHLYQLGHRRIDCFNSHPASPTMEQRAGVWRSSLERLGCQGKFHNHPIDLFFPAVHAYEKMNEILAHGQLQATALFCLGMDEAQGVLRSCHEHGVNVPGDLSVCSFGNPEKARLCVPSVTIVDRPDIQPEIRSIYNFFLGRGGDPNRLMYRPEAYKSLLIGESTGNAPRTTPKRLRSSP